MVYPIVNLIAQYSAAYMRYIIYGKKGVCNVGALVLRKVHYNYRASLWTDIYCLKISSCDFGIYRNRQFLLAIVELESIQHFLCPYLFKTFLIIVKNENDFLTTCNIHYLFILPKMKNFNLTDAKVSALMFIKPSPVKYCTR